MSRRYLRLASLLGALALLLPPGWTAHLLVGAGSPRSADVVVGLWWLKGILLAHGAILLLLGQLEQAGRLAPAASPYSGGLEPEVRGSAREWTLLAGLLALGLGLRLYRLGEGLWFDEIQTLVDYVRHPLGQLLTLFDSKNQHLFYSVLARGTVSLFGDSAWALRLPAALLGTASLWATYRFGRLVAPRVEAWLAALLLTVSYHHVWFSQDARGYTGLLLFSLLGTTEFLRLLAGRGRPGPGTAALYGLWMALAVYTHMTAALIVLAHGIVWLFCWWREPGARSDWRPAVALGLAGSFSLLLYAPVLPQVVHTILAPTMGGTRTAWKSPLWFVSETLRVLAAGVPGGLLTVAVAAAVGCAGVVSYARRSAALLSVMLLPMVLSAAAFLVIEQNLWPRFFFFAAGFLVLIALRGGFVVAGWLLPRRLALVPVAVVVLVALASLWTVPRAWRPKQDFAGARDWVRAHAGPDDAVVTVDLTRYPCDRYYDCGFLSADTAEQLRSIEGDHRATWVLYTFPIRLAAVAPAMWQRLATVYREEVVFPGTVGGGAIVVLRHGGPTS